jgi:hypothetical protein
LSSRRAEARTRTLSAAPRRRSLETPHSLSLRAPSQILNPRWDCPVFIVVGGVIACNDATQGTVWRVLNREVKQIIKKPAIVGGLPQTATILRYGVTAFFLVVIDIDLTRVRQGDIARTDEQVVISSRFASSGGRRRDVRAGGAKSL